MVIDIKIYIVWYMMRNLYHFGYLKMDVRKTKITYIFEQYFKNDAPQYFSFKLLS